MQKFIRTARPDAYTAKVNLRQRRTWFNDPPPPAPAPATPPIPTPPTPQPPAPELPKSDAGDSGDVEKLLKTFLEGTSEDMPEWVSDPKKAYAALRKLRKENEAKRKESRELEAEKARMEAEKRAADDKKLVEQNEWEKLAKQRESDLNAIKEKHAAELLDMQRQIVAARFVDRLPKPTNSEVDPVAEFAKRLQGNGLDELRQDAEKLIALFSVPQAAPPAQPEAPATPTLETIVQRNPTTTTAVPGGQPVTRTDADRHKDYFGSGKSSPMFNPGNGGKVIYHGNPGDLE